MKIGQHKIQQHQKPFIIAEIGVNHNGDIKLAHRLIDEAHSAGAHAVKFQTFNVNSIVSEKAQQALYQSKNTGRVETQKAMLARYAFNKAQFQELKNHCDSVGTIFLSSPFDEESVRLLLDLNVSALKIPSGEITNKYYLQTIGKTRLPVILSTGMSNLAEVETAINTLKTNGTSKISLLHCLSQYPACPEYMNLRAINTLNRAFNLPTGFSDHSEDNAMTIAAIALGACVIEKHFTLDKKMKGPDHLASSEPKEFEDMCQKIHMVHAALGNGEKICQPVEKDTKKVARKSIIANRDIYKGEIIDWSMLSAKRPGDGICPFDEQLVLNRTVKRLIKQDSKIKLDDLI